MNNIQNKKLKIKKILNYITYSCGALLLIILPMAGITISGQNGSTTYTRNFSQWQVLFGSSENHLKFNIFVLLIFVLALAVRLIALFMKNKKLGFKITSIAYLGIAILLMLNKVFFTIVNNEVVKSNASITINIGYGMLIGIFICLAGAYCSFLSTDYVEIK